MLATYEAKSRIRMYLLVTVLCGAAAALMQVFLAGTSQFSNYAEEQLDSAVRGAVHQEATEISQSQISAGGHR